MAVLSGKVPNYVPPNLRDEEGWCRLATDGLQGKLEDLLRDETETVHTRGMQSGTIPNGYGSTGFNKWDVFYAMAVSKATNLGIAKHCKRGGVGGGGGAKDGGRDLSSRTHNRLNKERAHYGGPPHHTDGLLRSATAASPKSMLSKPLISNRLCHRASPLIRSAL